MTTTTALAAPAERSRTTRRVQRARQARRRWLDRLVPIVMVLLGALVLAYPVGATYYNNYKQSEFARQYSTKVASADPVQLREELNRARSYNATLNPTLLRDPWSEADAALDRDYREYLTQLDLIDTMARIRIPSLKVDLPVLHGTSDATLARGVGHLFGSALPVGGAGTHAVLTGHSSLANATLFDHLADLRDGDEFYVDVLGDTLAYRVDKITVVLPNQLDDLVSTPGRDQLTLVTCTPYAVNSHRLLVRGTRIPYDQTQAPTPTQQQSMDWSIQSWMWPRLIGAAAALGVLCAMILGWLISDRRRAERRNLTRSTST
jgi:sortase A